MESKNKLLNMLSDLKYWGYSRRSIENSLGYKENYIDQQLSKGANNRFFEAINKFHKLKQMEFHSREDIKMPPKTTEEILSGILEKDIEISARLLVLERTVDQISASYSNRSIAIVAGERMQAVSMQAEQLMAELRKKS